METEIFKNIQVKIEDLPSIKDLRFVPLEKAYLKIVLINTLIVYVVMLAGLIAAWFFTDELKNSPYFQWILLIFLALFLLNLVFIFKSFQHKSYAFRQKDISYKSGWLWRKITTIPFNRVQHCEVSQGIFDRMFGLSRIKIFTAGGSSSDVSIPGLLPDEAAELKEFILGKVQENEE